MLGGGAPGTQSNGGAGQSGNIANGIAGALGQGAKGARGLTGGTYYYASGGGGGGYYGGGSGGIDSGVNYRNGSGGGSGYLSPSLTASSMQTGVREGNGLVVITGINEAPNTPTLTTPAFMATVPLTQTIRLGWAFSDPNDGDTQSAADIRYRLVGAPTWTDTYWMFPNQYFDIAGGTLTAGDYEWTVRTYDPQGVVGPYASPSRFTAKIPPDGPTIISPTTGALMLVNETIVWSAPEQEAYQVRRVADSGGVPDTGTVYEDSGTVIDATTRSYPFTFTVNNRAEHLQVRVRNAGLWSPWASVAVYVLYEEPMTPAVTLNPDDATGTLEVVFTNPTPTSGIPATAYNEVWIDDTGAWGRRATNLPNNSAWTYWTPIGSLDYTPLVKVVAVGVNGARAEGMQIEGPPE